MTRHRIALIASDGIGHDGLAVGLRWVKAAADRCGIALQVDPIDFDSPRAREATVRAVEQSRTPAFRGLAHVLMRVVRRAPRNWVGPSSRCRWRGPRRTPR